MVGWLVHRCEPGPDSFRGGGLQQRTVQTSQSVHESIQEADGAAG